MTVMETFCTECDATTRNETPHCPDCGVEDPWEERPAYRFDESDLPIVFSYEVYRDNWELWRAFCDEYFGVGELKGGDVAGMPDSLPSLKYCVTDLYFVLTEDYELEGPFLSKSAAREAIADSGGDSR